MHEYRESAIPTQIGKTVFVTDASTGIGYETAKILAELGAGVLLGCRSEQKTLGFINRINRRRVRIVRTIAAQAARL
ncbi:MAG: NAD(P)-dependent dehydrogenase (short-subunit alcohol dehydrogenase family) [Gammaproteobacteria bacterium]|jgi:NAD(P)-dependent dehydrogenase (short-subunit alcohol dehydrogenase family)